MRLLMLLSLITLSTCGPKRLIRTPVEATWVSQGNRFDYADRWLDVRFEVTSDGHFSWRFKNNGLSRVAIDHESFGIFDERNGIVTRYGPWGEEVVDADKMPRLVMNPGKVVVLSYPVRFRSPLRPFRPIGKRYVSFTARWQMDLCRYRLNFPSEEPP